MDSTSAPRLRVRSIVFAGDPGSVPGAAQTGPRAAGSATLAGPEREPSTTRAASGSSWTDLLDAEAILDRADPREPLVWAKGDDVLVGAGVAWRIETHGADRIRDAAEAWRELCERADVVDRARVPGSGLVAFGAIAFSARSEAPSTLIVPSVVIGRRDGVTFVTHIEAREEAPAIDAIDAAGSADAADPAASGPGLRTASFSLVPLPRPAGVVPATELREGRMTAVAHAAATATALERIDRGRFDKVVLARDLVGRVDARADLRILLRRLRDGYPGTWLFAVDGFVGASPETLVRVIDGRVSARVLAGTAPRGADPESDAANERALLESGKNRREHAFAVDSALDSLRGATGDDTRAAARISASPMPFTLRLPNVWHLASDIHGPLPEGRTVLDLVAALHPTAAVGGTPTDAAVEAIDELEPFDRRRYAGPVGWVGADGDGEWAVGLRSAEVDADGTVTAFAGGGIVASSLPEEEFAETVVKFRPIVEALRP